MAPVATRREPHAGLFIEAHQTDAIVLSYGKISKCGAQVARVIKLTHAARGVPKRIANVKQQAYR